MEDGRPGGWISDLKSMGNTTSKPAAALWLAMVVSATACSPISDDRGRHATSSREPSSEASLRAVLVRMGGRSYHIPPAYFPAPPLSSKTEQSGMALRVALPELSPCCGTEEGSKAPDGSHKMNIIVRRKGSEPPLGEIHRSVEKTGLTFDDRVGLPFARSRHYATDRVYFGADGASIIAVLNCDRQDTGNPTQCHHTFDYSDLRVMASYDSAFAPRWRTLQESITALLDRFAESN